jgi:Bacteriophage head to tail connecting protein
VTAEQDLRRWRQLLSERTQHESVWRELEALFMPGRGALALTTEAPGTEPDWRKTTKSTGIQAADMLAAALAGGLTAPGSEWFSLTLRDPELQKDGEIQAWLEDTTRRMHGALSESTAYQELQTSYLDLVVFGTGALFVDEMPGPAEWNGIRVRSWPIGSYAIDEGPDGTVDTVYHLVTLSARQALVAFGPHADWTQLAEAGADRPIEILHVVAPVKDRPVTEPEWRSCYVDVKQRSVIEESRYFEMPALCARWAKRAGDRWGRGPGHNALADTRTLCAVVGIVLKAAPLAIQPPTVELEDSVIGDVEQRPGGRTRIKIPGGLQVLENRMRMDVSQLVVKDLVEDIRAAFFWQQMILPTNPAMTATEVQMRWQQMQRTLGPTLGRLTYELLSPFLRRLLRILARAGQLAPLPDILRELGPAADLDIVYESPLSRAQRTGDLVAIDQLVGSTLALAQAYPGVLDLLDADAIVRERARLSGVPQDILRPARQVTQLRQQRAQQEALQKQLQMGQQVAEIAGEAGPALESFAAAGQQMRQNGAGPPA